MKQAILDLNPPEDQIRNLSNIDSSCQSMITFNSSFPEFSTFVPDLNVKVLLQSIDGISALKYDFFIR